MSKKENVAVTATRQGITILDGSREWTHFQMELETDWWRGLLESADEDRIVGLMPAPGAAPKHERLSPRDGWDGTEETGSPLIYRSSGTVPWLRAGEETPGATTSADSAFRQVNPPSLLDSPRTFGPLRVRNSQAHEAVYRAWYRFDHRCHRSGTILNSS